MDGRERILEAFRRWGEWRRARALDVEGLSDEQIVRRSRVYLVAGVLGSEELGEERCDRLLRMVAHGNIRKSLELGAPGFGAGLLGFSDQGELQAQLSSEAPLALITRPELEELVVRADELFQDILDATDVCFEENIYIEVIRPAEPHDRSAWKAANGVDPRVGEYRFTSSTSAGDRAFALHFSSANFPDLDADLVAFDRDVKAYRIMAGIRGD